MIMNATIKTYNEGAGDTTESVGTKKKRGQK